jgi:hypothetical protein
MHLSIKRAFCSCLFFISYLWRMSQVHSSINLVNNVPLYWYLVCSGTSYEAILHVNGFSLRHLRLIQWIKLLNWACPEPRTTSRQEGFVRIMNHRIGLQLRKIRNKTYVTTHIFLARVHKHSRLKQESMMNRLNRRWRVDQTQLVIRLKWNLSFSWSRVKNKRKQIIM